MYTKVVLLFVSLLLISLAPLNSAPDAQLTRPSISEQPQVAVAKEKPIGKKRKARTPVLPAIALSLGIIAIVSFILLGLPGIIIGGLAVIVGSIVLTRRNGYTKRDRIMARIGVLLGSLFLFAGILIIIALLEPTGVNLEVLEPLLDHVLG